MLGVGRVKIETIKIFDSILLFLSEYFDVQTNNCNYFGVVNMNKLMWCFKMKSPIFQKKPCNWSPLRDLVPLVQF